MTILNVVVVDYKLYASNYPEIVREGSIGNFHMIITIYQNHPRYKAFLTSFGERVVCTFFDIPPKGIACSGEGQLRWKV